MKKLSVLVLDDDVGTRRIIERILRMSYEATVVEANENWEALEILSRAAVDLVITDLIHPGPTGLDFLQDVRGRSELANVPVVVQSGHARELAFEVWKAGATQILPKPFTIPAFLEAVDAALAIQRDPDSALLEVGTETPSLDYKGLLPLETRDQRAAFAKDVIAFANHGGGHVVVGVEEPLPGEFVLVGVTKEHAEALEATRLNRALRRFLDPPVHVRTRRITHGRRTYVVLEIPAATKTLILAASENEWANLRRGRIYCRTASAESAEIDSADDLRRIIDRVLEERSFPNTLDK